MWLTIKLFIDDSATLKKGWGHESTLIEVRSYFLCGYIVHLYRVFTCVIILQ